MNLPFTLAGQPIFNPPGYHVGGVKKGAVRPAPRL